MEKYHDPWREIARLIEKDKEGGLDYLRKHEFTPVAASLGKPVLRPALWLAAASLLLAAGLVSFWLLRGSWQSSLPGSAGSDLLAGSFLYAAAGSGESARPGAGAAVPVSPQFAAWADALERSTTVTDRSVPAIPAGAGVDRGDPEELRQRLGRAIRTGAFERLLSHWQEFHEKDV